MTAGRVDTDLSPFLTRSLLDTLIREMKEEFDLILFDTSPLLVQNRSNIDPALLSLVCDMVVLVVQDKRTTKSELQNAIAAIPQGGRKIRGIVYNHQF
jgi:Mrp family chromosome partitioning ATPase